MSHNMNQNVTKLENVSIESFSTLRADFQRSTPEEQVLQRQRFDLQEKSCTPEVGAFGNKEFGHELTDLQSLKFVGDQSVGVREMINRLINLRCTDSKLSHKAVSEECCVELKVQTNHISEENKAFGDIFIEICEKSTELEASRECSNENCVEEGVFLKDGTEIKMNVATLRREKGVLLEAIEQAKCQLAQQAALKDCIDESNNDRICLLAETKALQDELAKLNQKFEPEEKLWKHYEEVENEIAALSTKKSDLLDEFNFAKSKLVEQALLKNRCFELEAEKNRISAENGYIRQNISRMAQKIAQNKICQQKLKEIERSKMIMESENMALNAELVRRTQEYDAEKLEADKQKVLNIEDLKRQNATIQGEVYKMSSQISRCKALRDCYKQIIKGDAEVRAKNKKLAKKQEECYNKLKKLDNVEKKMLEQVKLGMDVLRAENRHLHESIWAINEEIKNKKMLQVHLETLKDEQKLLTKINSNLKKEVLQLEKVKKKQQPIHDKNAMLEEKNKLLRQENEQLQKQYEDVFVLTNTREVAEISSKILLREWIELDRVNKKVIAQTKRRMASMT